MKLTSLMGYDDLRLNDLIRLEKHAGILYVTKFDLDDLYSKKIGFSQIISKHKDDIIIFNGYAFSDLDYIFSGIKSKDAWRCIEYILINLNLKPSEGLYKPTWKAIPGEEFYAFGRTAKLSLYPEHWNNIYPNIKIEDLKLYTYIENRLKYKFINYEGLDHFLKKYNYDDNRAQVIKIYAKGLPRLVSRKHTVNNVGAIGVFGD